MLATEEFYNFGFTMLEQGETPSDAETTFSSEWKAKYFSEEFYLIDPIFHHAKQNIRRSTFRLLSRQEMETNLFEEAKLYDADSNFISISNLAGNQFVFGGVNHDLNEKQAKIEHTKCQLAHRTLLIEKIDGLSDRQIEMLEMAEEGMLDKEISEELARIIHDAL